MLSKIKKNNIHQSPVPYIVINDPIDLKRYDALYEQWNNPSHETWKKFLKEHNVEIILKNKLKSITHQAQNEFVGYWFFRQRTDRRSIHICFNEIKIEYKANRLLILKAEQKFSVINKSLEMPDMLNCVVYFSTNQQNKIKEFLSL